MKTGILLLLGAICLPSVGNAQIIPGDRPPESGEEKRVLTALNRSPDGIPRIEALLEAGYYYLLFAG